MRHAGSTEGYLKKADQPNKRTQGRIFHHSGTGQKENLKPKELERKKEKAKEEEREKEGERN